MLSLYAPLAKQKVDSTDSVLGALAVGNGNGLNTTYNRMIMDAFRPEYWSSASCINGSQALNGIATVADNYPQGCPNSYTQMETNFSLFWGLVLSLYESTLRADNTPFDQYAAGSKAALDAAAVRGLNVFTGQGRCGHCHSGGELSKAAVSQARSASDGFENIGVRPLSEDGGQNGRFKTPQLRNVELRGPYFHNGGTATLRQVVEFYNRGGDNPREVTSSQIRSLSLSEQQKQDLVSFLVALTDNRVRYEKAPFDHPSLDLIDGHANDGIDTMRAMPAVGVSGRSSALQPFLGLAPQQP